MPKQSGYAVNITTTAQFSRIVSTANRARTQHSEVCGQSLYIVLIVC